MGVAALQHWHTLTAFINVVLDLLQAWTLQVKVASGILTTLNTILDELVWTSMFSSQVLQHYRHTYSFIHGHEVLSLSIHCAYNYVVVKLSIILWSVWVIQLVWWPFLQSESEHGVPTTFLEPVKWVSIRLRPTHMLPQQCFDMLHKSLVCGIHLLWISLNIPLEWVKLWVDSNCCLCAALWVRPSLCTGWVQELLLDAGSLWFGAKYVVWTFCLIRDRIVLVGFNDFGSIGFGKVQRVYGFRKCIARQRKATNISLKGSHKCFKVTGPVGSNDVAPTLRGINRDIDKSVIPDLSKSKSFKIYLSF